MNWYNFVKKYVWDETKTPYLTGIDRLSKEQAHSELFIYVFFLVSLFGVIALVSIARMLEGEGVLAIAASVVAVFVVVSACMLHATKHLTAALYCLIAPVASAGMIITDALGRPLEAIDKYFLIGITGVWLWYAFRVVAIARRFPAMPDRAKAE